MSNMQLYTKLGSNTIRCDACPWRCNLHSEEMGRCLMRSGAPDADGLTLHNSGLISAAEVGAVEDYRLWHFFPDTMVLSIGSWGYAFPADQQRGAYAHIPDTETSQRKLAPERVASFALNRLCRGVIWAYGDSAVSCEYVREVLQACRAASRYTALISTGFMTLEVLDSLGPYLDGICLDLRGFGDTAYSRLAGITNWQDILEVVARAYHHWKCHIEITTRVHHGVNDDPDELRALVHWVSTTLDAHIPWHVLPGDRGVETAASVVRARRIGHENGLHYVYGAEPNQPTQCPQCQTTLITRDKGVTSLVGFVEGRCKNCGFQPYMRTSIFKR